MGLSKYEERVTYVSKAVKRLFLDGWPEQPFEFLPHTYSSEISGLCGCV